MDMSDSISPVWSTHQLQKLGNYWLVGELARGGMGAVYLGIAPGGDRIPAQVVVLKALLFEDAPTEAQLLAFGDEAEVAMSLKHPNVVRTLDVAVDGARHFMVLEHLDGQALSRIEKRLSRSEGARPLVWAYAISEALLGLHAAHELKSHEGKPRELVHRDISPQNIFVTYAGDVKLMDFGIAKIADASTHTSAGVLKGKVAFMAPEQVLGTGLDRRADLFAMGLVLFELVAGKRLWGDLGDVEIVRALLEGAIPDPVEVAPNVPAALVPLLRKALAPSASDRFPTALVMRAALRDALEAEGLPPFMPRVLSKELTPLFDADRKRAEEIVRIQLETLKLQGEKGIEALLRKLGQPSRGMLHEHPGTAARSGSPSARPGTRSLPVLAPRRASQTTLVWGMLALGCLVALLAVAFFAGKLL